ncbi:MAG: hypothetical protein Tsb0013_12490 [Phycisphaerales bacterium]
MTARGFTLLELLVVLALLAVVAGLTASSLGRGAPVRRAGETLVTRLLDARVIAMRSGVDATLEVRETARGLSSRVVVHFSSGDEAVREGDLGSPGLVVVDETPDFGWGGREGEAEADGVVRARYAPSGRTAVRRWAVRDGGSGGESGSGGRMVVIGFDPITGVPGLHRER